MFNANVRSYQEPVFTNPVLVFTSGMSHLMECNENRKAGKTLKRRGVGSYSTSHIPEKILLIRRKSFSSRQCDFMKMLRCFPKSSKQFRIPLLLTGKKMSLESTELKERPY